MLNILRQKGVSKRIIWFIVIIIIISFGFLGTAYLITDQGQQDTSAGKIFGKKVSIEKFDRAYQDVTIQAIIRYGEKFNSIRQFLNLDSEAWDRLILQHEANKRNIKISDEEVIKAIEEYPFFQRDGQFDSLLYKDILRYVFKIEPRQFEENVRDTLRLGKLVDQETANIELTEQDIFKAFQETHSKVQVSYIFVAPDEFKNQAVSTDEEEKSYYENNKMDFILPASLKVSYVTLNIPTTPNQTADEINAAKDTVLAKAKEISADFSAGDFEAAAKKNNLTVQTTDYFSPDQPNLTLGWPISTYRDIVNLKTGEVSQPLETGKGISIIKIVDKKESYTPEFAQVQAKVKEAVLIRKAKSIAKDKANAVLKQVKDAMSQASFVEFPAVAKNLGLNIEQTPVFTRGQYLPKLGIEREFQDTAFSLNDQNKLSDVVETQTGWAILYLDRIVPAEQTDFEKQKQEFANSLLSEKKMTAFSDFLTGLRLKANLLDNISKLRAQNQ